MLPTAPALALFALLAAALPARAAEGGDAQAASHAAPAPPAETARTGSASPREAIPPCGPEAAAVLGGEDDTACLPRDIGPHGEAVVPSGTGAGARARQPRH